MAMRGTFRSICSCGKKRPTKHFAKERGIVHRIFVEFVGQAHLGALCLNQMKIGDAALVEFLNHESE